MSEDFVFNRRAWDATSDEYQARHREQLSARPKGWGVWSLPESELQMLGDVRGRDVLEYGCGGAQWSIALAHDGARVTALDNSARQLAHARDAIAEAGAQVRLIHAPGERTPFEDAAFDVVFCDHGAMSFAAPEITIPEVARILRAGGTFAFSVEHPLHAACCGETGPPSHELARPYFGTGPTVYADDDAITHNRSIATYVELLLINGFVIEKLLEPQPSLDALTSYDDFAPLEWARRYPAELLVRARRR